MSHVKLLTSTLFLGLLAAPAAASAQSHDLPFAQAGAALDYAGMEVRVLNAAIKAKQFDLGFTKATLAQIEAALAEAKRNVDRAETLLPEKLSSKSKPVLALREKIVAAETQREALTMAVVWQTKVLTVEDEDEAAELPPTDWKLLERQTGWLAQDVSAASSAHKKLMRPLKVSVPKKVAKPRGKREPIPSVEE